MLKKVNYQDAKFQSKESEKNKINEFEINIINNQKKIDILHIKKKKNYFDFYNKDKKIISKSIDISA